MSKQNSCKDNGLQTLNDIQIYPLLQRLTILTMRFSFAAIPAVIVASAVAVPAGHPDVDYKAMADTLRLVLEGGDKANTERSTSKWPPFEADFVSVVLQG